MPVPEIDTREVVTKLLQIKYNAEINPPLSSDDCDYISTCFSRGGPVAILAACCVVSSHVDQFLARGIALIEDFILQRKPSGLYVELSVCEAFTGISLSELSISEEKLMDWLEQTKVSVGNIISLLHRLANHGNRRAIIMLMRLKDDTGSHSGNE